MGLSLISVTSLPQFCSVKDGDNDNQVILVKLNEELYVKYLE